MAEPAEQPEPAEALPEEALPNFVVGPASRARWEQVCRIVDLIDPEGSAEDKWYARRSLFWSDIPTG